jgi:hypothetical protein
MEPPWFHVPWDAEKMRYECGEDVYFCKKATAAGFEILLDHDLSKDVYHIGNMEFGYMESLAARPHIKQLKQHFITKGGK